MTPEVTVCIVNHDGGPRLQAAVASAYEASPQVAVAVILVDNASSDGSAEEVARRWPEVRLIANRENVGFARANNQAIKEATGAFYLLLNNDAVLQPGALAAMLQHARQAPRIAFVGCKVVNGEGNLQVTYGPPPTLREYAPSSWYRTRLARRIVTATTAEGRATAARRYERRYAYDRTHTVDNLSGVCLLVRADAVREIGLLDERYFMYYEDLDWCARALAGGWRALYVAEATVNHAWRPHTVKPGSASLFHHMQRSRGLYLRTHCGPASAWVVAAGLAVAGAFRSIGASRGTERPPGPWTAYMAFREGMRLASNRQGSGLDDEVS